MKDEHQLKPSEGHSGSWQHIYKIIWTGSPIVDIYKIKIIKRIKNIYWKIYKKNIKN